MDSDIEGIGDEILKALSAGAEQRLGAEKVAEVTALSNLMWPYMTESVIKIMMIGTLLMQPPQEMAAASYMSGVDAYRNALSCIDPEMVTKVDAYLKAHTPGEME